MFGFCQPARAAPGIRPDTLGRPAASPCRYLPSGDCAVRITEIQLFTVRRTSAKLTDLAGSESGMDAFADDIGPEAAATLRELGSGSPR